MPKQKVLHASRLRNARQIVKLTKPLRYVSGVKDNSAIRKSPRSVQCFELSMAGVPDPKETAQRCGLRVQNMNFRGHENHGL